MMTKERLDLLNREAEAADDAYELARESAHMSMASRYQPALLSPRVRALKDARDAASMRLSDANMAYDRQPS
jgi:hypothetical protein